MLFSSLAPSPALAWLDPAEPGVDAVVNTQDNQCSFYGGEAVLTRRLKERGGAQRKAGHNQNRRFFLDKWDRTE